LSGRRPPEPAGRPSIDLNADLGEGHPLDLPLLEVVTSASVACGLHAGDPVTMVETARQAARRGVVVGAHPSYDDRAGFGRRPLDLRPAELVTLVAYQLGAMAAAAGLAGTGVRFVKPHGALYNQAATDPRVADAIVEAVTHVPAAGGHGLALLCPAGSALARSAAGAGVTVFTEGFVDRAYAPDGTLVPRSDPGALITEPEEAAARALSIATRRTVAAADGSDLPLEADSLCIHGDSPGALRLAEMVRGVLEDAGVAVVSFLEN